MRFEQFLFDGAGSDDKAYRESPLINYYPDDPQFMYAVDGFVNDPAVRHIYRVSDSLYHDLSWLEKELGGALGRAEKLLPGLHYDRFFTLLTADFEDYQNRVFCSKNELAVSIERYAVVEMADYQYFGLPAYIVAQSTREHIAADCMAAIAREHIALPEGELTLLDYAIAEGKALYFCEQTLPKAADTILLRYTGEQMTWMEHNVANVWAWLIQNKMLYSRDYGQFHNIIDEAPKTNAFGEGSAPRTTSYIGWQIVKRYMKKNGKSMKELFEETDSQKILTESGWRP